MRINVTHEDIEVGVKNNCLRCPIAAAIGRHLMSRAFVSVAPRVANIICGGRVLKIALPQEAIDFVRRFDEGKAGRPFAFELDIPAEALACVSA